MGRAPCCDKANVKRGPWSPEEDATLRSYVETHGTGGNWIALPRKAGLRRCGKSCRLRWLNYLRPDIKHGGFTEEEDNIICTLYAQMGSRWSAIASQLPGRTDNDVKNYWNTKLKKKLMAGKVILKTINENGSTLPSTPLQTQYVETHNSEFPASQSQSSSTPPLSALTDSTSGFNFNIKAQTMVTFDPVQLYGPGSFVGVSEIGSTQRNNHTASLSQLGPGISNSPSIGTEKCVLLTEHAGMGDGEVLMDFGFGFPCDFFNNSLYSQNQDVKVGEFAASSYPELVDFGYADIKPQGLNQNVV